MAIFKLKGVERITTIAIKMTLLNGTAMTAVMEQQ